MRLHLFISGSGERVPFNYQPILTGAIHKWLGQNEDHGKLSLYSFSWLQGGKVLKDGLVFNGKTNFFISAYDSDFLKKIITGIQNDNRITDNLLVKEIVVQENPEFENKVQFFMASPVFIKRIDNGKEIHYIWKDSKSDQFLTDTLKHKLRVAELSDEGVSVAFDRSYHSPRTKVIYYKNIGNKASLCPVIIEGSPEQIAFAWNVGVGNSTGIGFGALR